MIRIVGAGPTGSLLAILLQRRGFEITLYETRADRGTHAQSRADPSIWLWPIEEFTH